MYNAVRGTRNARQYFLQPGENREDLLFTLDDLEKVGVGDNFTIVVNIKVITLVNTYFSREDAKLRDCRMKWTRRELWT